MHLLTRYIRILTKLRQDARTEGSIINIMINYVENFLCFRLIKYVACGVSIYMIACNFHINSHHFLKGKSNQIFLRKDSGLV
jgi:hypothetical protein